MAKYTEEQLLQIKEETTYVPQPTILAAFNELIDQVKEHAHQQQQAEHARNGTTETLISTIVEMKEVITT